MDALACIFEADATANMLIVKTHTTTKTSAAVPNSGMVGLGDGDAVEVGVGEAVRVGVGEVIAFDVFITETVLLPRFAT